MLVTALLTALIEVCLVNKAPYPSTAPPHPTHPTNRRVLYDLLVSPFLKFRILLLISIN